MLHRHRCGHGGVVLVAFEAEVARLDQFQPLRLINAGLGEFRYAVRDHQFWHRERLAGQLFVEHVQVVFIHVGIANEVGEPAWRVAGQAADQAQQGGAFGQVERRAQQFHPPPLLHITLTCNAFQATWYMCIIAFAHYLRNP